MFNWRLKSGVPINCNTTALFPYISENELKRDDIPTGLAYT
jgi:hypothetical protein